MNDWFCLSPLRNWRPVLVASSLLLACIPARAADAPEAEAFFEKKIRPVLAAKCYRCHSAQAKSPKGGLLLDTRDGIRKGGDLGAAVVPGNVADSLLLKALRYEDGLEMPPDGRLAPEVVADFARWIALGAPDPRIGKAPAAARAVDIEEGRKHWAYQPIARPAIPQTQDNAWPRSDIDRFILAGLEARKLRPVADAGPLELLRRIRYDLTGLPPTPQEVEAFAERSRPDPAAAVASLVEELLASPRFGERWGRHWLDVARYAESNGGGDNVLVPLAPRYRDYVIDAFNADTPFDRFIVEQIAGDLLPAADDARRNEQLVATGFLALGPKDLRERNGHRFRMAIAEDQIDLVGRAFLGQTVACARCHDHKYDPIPTRDYYALAGIFYSSQPLMGVWSKNTRWVADLQPLAGSGVAPLTERDLKNLAQAASNASRASINLRDERHRILSKAGLLKAPAQAQQAILEDAPSVQQASAARDKQQAAYLPLRDRYLATMRQSTIAMRDVEPKDLAIHIRGEDSLLGDVVPRGFLQVLTNTATPDVNRSQSGRLELARWIASADNPLTARVIVNRVWQHLFGAGLVDAPDNFGTTSPPPSNPQLLDHLAQRLLAHGWSVKALIREIMLSRVYQLGSAHEPAAYEVDADNRLHWRMNRRRHDSDALFDSLLFVSGELKLGRPPLRFAIVEGDQRVKSFDRKAWLAPMVEHRTVYHPIFREFVPHDWSVFDFPEPDLLVGRRDVTTVPTQALYLMNSAFVVERSRQLARRLRAEPQGESDTAAVRRAYLHVLGRVPSREEADEAEAFLRQFPPAAGQRPDAALAAFCQTLFASAEFRSTY